MGWVFDVGDDSTGESSQVASEVELAPRRTVGSGHHHVKGHECGPDLRLTRQLFIFPPFVDLPGSLLPTIASTDRLAPYRPASSDGFTRLSLKHAPKASDTAIARLLFSMPSLEDINLKGCTLAGSQTADMIRKHCKSLKKLNLKGTNVNEVELREILDLYGKQLEVLKVDRMAIEVGPLRTVPDVRAPRSNPEIDPDE